MNSAHRSANDSVSALKVNPRPPAPDVAASEIAARQENIRREMHKDGIDALVLTDIKNIQYFTGFSTLSWNYKARPGLGLITATDVFIFASLGEAKAVELKPRAFTPQYYDGYLAECVELLSATLRTKIKSNSCIGIDYGQDFVGLGSLDLVDALRGLSPGAKLQAAGPTIWRVRLIKTKFEADLKRTAFDIVDSAFDQTISMARIGMPEYELSQLMQAQIFLNGAETADPIPLIFSKGDFTYGRAAGERRLEDGHYIWTDFRATYGGYPADRNRTARAGEPTAWEQETYTATRNLTHTLCNSVKAGMTCADVYAKCNELWEGLNLGKRWAGVSRIGHGGGLDITEPPSLSATDQQEIKPGMILHIEPKVELNGAVFQFEEVIFIREDGIDFLAPLSPASIPLIK